jgi:hypothetical protein
MAAWLEALEKMAAQTTTLLQRIEQARDLSSGGHEGQAEAAEGQTSACPEVSSGQQTVSPPPWESLIEQVKRSVESADRSVESVLYLCQQWQQRYARWHQLLEQSLKAPR